MLLPTPSKKLVNTGAAEAPKPLSKIGQRGFAGTLASVLTLPSAVDWTTPSASGVSSDLKRHHTCQAVETRVVENQVKTAVDDLSSKSSAASVVTKDY